MLVVLDLDGVVVDYGASSREAATRAAGAYFEDVIAIPNGARLSLRRHMDAFKAAGGFVDDRDLAYAFLYMMLTSMPRVLRPKPPRRPPRRIAEVRRAFQPMDIRLHALMGHSERSLEPTLVEINKRGGGLEALKRHFADGVMERYILRGGKVGATEAEAALGANAPKALREAAAAEPEDAVGRLFEEFYWGDARFQERRGIAPLKPRGEGLMDAETLLVSRESLVSLASRVALTLVTSQPRPQVQQTLRNLGVEGLFPHIVYTYALGVEAPPRHPLEEVLPQGFGAWMLKPIISAAAEVHAISPSPRTLRLLSNDAHRIQVASRAGVRCVGFARQREERRVLQDAGAQAVSTRLKTLLKAL